MSLAEEVFRRLDDGDRSVALQCSEFMCEYFNGISFDEIAWFVAENLDEKTVRAP
jgi:hypothetical protein